MENNIRQLPTLGFVEGVRLAFSRLNDFKGRSRRSEMWWWMMLVLILISFVGISYVRFKLPQMFVWSILFAVAVGAIEICGMIRKHRKNQGNAD
mgnify:CR=1 FL=1